GSARGSAQFAATASLARESKGGSSAQPPALDRLPKRDLVGDEAEDRVGDVAVDAGGDEVDEVQVDEGDGECAVDDFAVDLRREPPCRRFVGRVEADRVLALAVESRVAEPPVAVRVRGGAAEVVGEEVDRVRVLPADGGDLDPVPGGG